MTFVNENTMTSALFKTLLLSFAFILSTAVFGQDNRQQYYFEQAEYETAKSERSISALNRFIRKYPHSKFKRTAVYERDRLAYVESANSDSSASVQNFIDNYPRSAWLPKAKYMLKQLKQSERGSTARTKVASAGDSKVSAYQSSSENSMDRVRKALSVYESGHNERQKVKEETEKQQVLLAKQQQKCDRLSDRLRTYNEGRRWYNLDAQGERQYLNDEQIARNHQNIKKKYSQHCG